MNIKRIAVVCDSFIYDTKTSWKVLENALVQNGYSPSEIEFFCTYDREMYEMVPDAKELWTHAEDFLIPNLQEYNPTHVLFFGNNAIVALHINKKAAGINKCRQKDTKIDVLNGLVGYGSISPGLVAREPSSTGDLWGDLAYYRRAMDGDAKQTPNLNIIDILKPDDIDELITIAKTGRKIYYDHETTGLDRDNVEVVTVTFCTGHTLNEQNERVYTVYGWAGYDELVPLFDDETHNKFKDKFKELFQTRRLQSVQINGWNSIGYDDWVSETWLGCSLPYGNDVMLSKWSVNTEKPHGLKQAVAKYLGYPNYDDEIDKFVSDIKKRRKNILKDQLDFKVLELFGYSPEKNKFNNKTNTWNYRWPKDLDRGLAAYACIPLKKLLYYNVLDSLFTCMSAEVFDEIIEKDDLSFSHQLRQDIAKELVRCEQHGFVLDKKINREYSKKLSKTLQKVNDSLKSIVNKDDFNPASSDQVSEILFGETYEVPIINRKGLHKVLPMDFDEITKACIESEYAVYKDMDRIKQMIRDEEFDDDYVKELLEQEMFSRCGMEFDLKFATRLVGLGGLGYDPVAVSKKTGKASCAKASLLTLAEVKESDFLNLVLMHRKSSKLKNDFIDKIYARVDHEGLIRTSYRPHGTISGRLSSSGNYNQQNYPKNVRGQFITRPDYHFLEMDLKNAEVFTLAAFSNDEYLLDAVRSSDVHKTMGSVIFKIPIEEVTDMLRSQAKNAVFLTVYGGGADKLAKMVGISIPEAQLVIDGFMNNCPDARKWMERQVEIAKEPPYFVHTAFGTRISTQNILSSDWGVASHIARVAVNAPIQGTAGELTLFYILQMMDIFRAEGLASPLDDYDHHAQVHLSATVHDSITLETHKELAYKNDAGEIRGKAYDIMRSVIDTPVDVEPLNRVQFKADFELNERCWSGEPNLDKALDGKDIREKFRWDILDKLVTDEFPDSDEDEEVEW